MTSYFDKQVPRYPYQKGIVTEIHLQHNKMYRRKGKMEKNIYRIDSNKLNEGAAGHSFCEMELNVIT